MDCSRTICVTETYIKRNVVKVLSKTVLNQNIFPIPKILPDNFLYFLLHFTENYHTLDRNLNRQ